MHQLTNAVRGYAWGSHHELAQFLGRAPSGQPEAELWIGAHYGDPSRLPDQRGLNDVISTAPAEMLGEDVGLMFENRLPFLMKVLAVDAPLSLQVHPSPDQARVGHARETVHGIPVDAAERSYKDPWHKPELIFALTRFEGMAGFREVAASASLLRLLHVRWSDTLAERLESGPVEDTLRDVTTDLLSMSGRPLARILHDVGHAARHAAARVRREGLRHRSPGGDVARVNREAERVFTQLGDLAQQYPKDPGALVTLLLNHVVLAPGEAMFVDAGVIHAYTSGVGLEIMASSDNVLRAGLTPKHCDVAELLKVTTFRPIHPPRWEPEERGSGFVHLQPPVSDFSLTVGRPPLRRVPATGPRVLLVLDGSVTVSTDVDTLQLTRGESVFVSHADGQLRVAGIGRVAIGSVPA